MSSLGSIGAWVVNLLSVVALLLGGCGGDATKPAESPDAESASPARTKSSAKASSDDDAGASETESAPAAACSDSTCFSCGSGYCPTGWYCDESASGGPACSWLPDCGKSSSCGCVEKALKGCSCKDESGGPHVTCK